MLAAIVGEVTERGPAFECAVGSAPDDLVARQLFETTTPAETIGRITEWIRFEASSRDASLAAVGIACFGPLQLDARATDYGQITASPRPGWTGFDIAGAVRRSLHVPVALETDVNAAAIAEARFGAAQGLDDIVYVTVSGGIGGGALVDGQPVHGRQHPEMGHVPVARHRSDGFPGRCRYHGGDCLEGLATVTALAERIGGGWRPEEARGHEVELEAWYLAQLTVGLFYTHSSARIILGGDAFRMPGLLGAVRDATVQRLGQDPSASGVIDGISDYLAAPELQGRAGLMGAMAIAHAAGVPGDPAR